MTTPNAPDDPATPARPRTFGPGDPPRADTPLDVATPGGGAGGDSRDGGGRSSILPPNYTAPKSEQDRGCTIALVAVAVLLLGGCIALAIHILGGGDEDPSKNAPTRPR